MDAMDNIKPRMRWIECLGCLGLLAVMAMIFLPPLAQNRNDHRKYACQNNLKQMGVIFQMYSGESRGQLYPPLMVENANLVDCSQWPVAATGKKGVVAIAPSVKCIYPEYLTDPTVFCDWRYTPTFWGGTRHAAQPGQLEGMKSSASDNIFGEYCDAPQQGARTADMSYYYLGYLFDKAQTDAGVNVALGPPQFATAFKPVIDAAQAGRWADAEALVQRDLPVSPMELGNGPATGLLHRLREGIERHLITDINNPAASAKARSETWILSDAIWDTPEQYFHLPGAANVLFLDGHVEFIKYDKSGLADPPVNQAMANAYATLRELAIR